MMTPIPFFELEQGEIAFSTEPYWPAAAKQQIWQDWRRFVYDGFKRVLFTTDIYRFLCQECSFAHFNQEAFWTFYFNAELSRLRLFLNQFSGSRQSAEGGTTVWLNGPAADLKAAMCAEMSPLHAPLAQVLQDLEAKHIELIVAWRDFALTCGVQAEEYPPHYLVSENTRNLLAYAADIARQRPLRQAQGTPLRGLQLCLSPYLLGATVEPALPAAA